MPKWDRIVYDSSLAAVSDDSPEAPCLRPLPDNRSAVRGSESEGGSSCAKDKISGPLPRFAGSTSEDENLGTLPNNCLARSCLGFKSDGGVPGTRGSGQIAGSDSMSKENHKRRPRRTRRRYAPFSLCECGDDHVTSCERQGQMQKKKVVAQPTERTSAEASRKIMPLMTVEPNGISTVDGEEWVEIDVAVDSGATETVMGEET